MNGRLAHGHPTGPSPVPGAPSVIQHLDQQTVSPVPAVTYVFSPGGGVDNGPLQQSLMSHDIPVQVMNQALASNPGLPGLFGERTPAGMSPREPQHTAVTDGGGQFRESPARPGGPPARTVQHVPGELQNAPGQYGPRQ